MLFVHLPVSHVCIHSFLDPSAMLLNDRDIVSLSGRNVTFGCIPSNQTLAIRWVFYRDDRAREVLSQNERAELIFEPPGLYHQVTIINASLDDTGIYSCEILPNCNDSFTVAYNMTLTVVPGKVQTFVVICLFCHTININ